MSPEVLVMSKTSCDKLSPEDRGDAQAAARNGSPRCASSGRRSEKVVAKRRSAPAAAQINAVDKQAFIDAMKPVYEKYVTDAKLKELVARIQARIELSLRSSDRPARPVRLLPDAFTEPAPMRAVFSRAVPRPRRRQARALDRRNRPGPHDRLRRLAGVRPLRPERLAELDGAGRLLLMSWFILLGAAVGVREGNPSRLRDLLCIMRRRPCAG